VCRRVEPKVAYHATLKECPMHIMALRAYTGGYRGCTVDEDEYLFFQFTRNGRFRRLKAYSKNDFEDELHFIALMLKFMSPGSFLRPAVAIDALTLAELDRVQALLSARTK